MSHQSINHLYRPCIAHEFICNLYCPMCKLYRCKLCYDIHYSIGSYNQSILAYALILNNAIETPISITKFIFHKIKYQLKLYHKYFLTNIGKTDKVIFYWKNTNVVVVNPKTHVQTAFPLNYQLNLYATSISHAKQIFVLGGNMLSTLEKIDFRSNLVVPKESMSIKKYYHCVFEVASYIYSIGGYNGQNLDDCQKYCVASNKWIQLPNLLMPRSLCGSFAFNNSYIYAYCGCNTNASNTMERLNITENKNWEKLPVQNSIACRYAFNCLQITATQVVIFGGFNIDGEKLSECCFLNINEKIDCVSAYKLAVPSAFLQNGPPILKNGVLYSVDHHCRVHIFSNFKWEVIEYTLTK